MNPMQTISSTALAERFQRHQTDLIDVRTPLEFSEVHIEGSHNIPLDTLDVAQVLASREGAGDDPVYLICRSGARSQRACDRLIETGFSQVFNVEGGVMAWEAAGLPVTRGDQVISLERQVRIAAGSLVLLGAGLGQFVHSGFFFVSAFVGAGLVFAGLTDSCAMGLLLAKMPWNQKGVCSSK